MNNFIYKGSIRHRRFTPFTNIFNYNTFMVFFDINNIENFFSGSLFFSRKKFAIASYFRSDYHGEKNKSLDQSVRATIKDKTGIDVNGPIRLLTHLRYFGYCFNPVSFYYCYDKNDTELQMIMAEVTNTPWNERHCYFITNKKVKVLIKIIKKNFMFLHSGVWTIIIIGTFQFLINQFLCTCRILRIRIRFLMQL